MTTTQNNGVYNIEGLTADQLAVIIALVNDAKASAEEQPQDEEIEVSVVLADNEVEILNGIELDF